MLSLFDSVSPKHAKGVELRKMFGNPCCFVNGKMFMGLHNNRLVLRLSEIDRTKLVAVGGKIFEPMPGRPMKEYVVVPAGMKQDALRIWVASSLSSASKLPAKSKKQKSNSVKSDTPNS
jgi:TfoX/Sxy family transcriptional regulator of competence genes